MSKKIKVGDHVEFKCDIEQIGKVVKIIKPMFPKPTQVVISNPYGFDGEYIGGETETIEPIDRVYKIKGKDNEN